MSQIAPVVEAGGPGVHLAAGHGSGRPPTPPAAAPRTIRCPTGRRQVVVDADLLRLRAHRPHRDAEARSEGRPTAPFRRAPSASPCASATRGRPSKTNRTKCSRAAANGARARLAGAVHSLEITERPDPTSPARPTTSPARTVNDTSTNVPRRPSPSTSRTTRCICRDRPPRGEDMLDVAAGHQPDELLRRGAATGRPLAMLLPSLMTVIRSPIWRISSSRCEM